MHSKQRIGFVSTRLAGTDGVSLETAKWVRILDELGYETFFFAGESDWPQERSYVIPEAHFQHPQILNLNIDLFDDYHRLPETSKQISELQAHLKNHLHKFIQKFELDILIIENAISLPLNVPLGLAITELVAETNIPTIAHHHDFPWERQRFAVSAGEDYLRAAFPPTMHSIRHVVINSFAERQLALRTGLSSIIIPNVMDFDSPPPNPDEYVKDFKPSLGIDPEDCMILQPTRVVPRKRIELSIELIRRLNINACLVITHHGVDEGKAYENYLREYASLLGVNVLFASERFAPERLVKEDGTKVYSLRDAYYEADLVSYPSRIEGFGNAFLETIFYKRPIIISNYEIFKTDIHPKGFKLITFTDFIDDNCVRQSKEILRNPELTRDMVEHNFETGRRHYSFRMLEDRLQTVLKETLGYD